MHSGFVCTTSICLSMLIPYALQISALSHGELSAEKTPMCQKVNPIIECLQSQWEELSKDPKYKHIWPALNAGLINMQKWYRAIDDTTIYFGSHSQSFCLYTLTSTDGLMSVLDPTQKLDYLSVAWDPSWIDNAMAQLWKVVCQHESFSIVCM